MAVAPEQIGIGIGRYFTEPATHPYDMVAWERREARIPNFKDGTDAFLQPDVEFPTTWSQNATNIVAQKYFRGTLGTEERETSLRQVIDRVADTITAWGIRDGYFVDDEEGAAFRNELKYILLTQRAAFNSPVWFNIGVKGERQQASACFILAVDDTMDAILNWYREEGVIFKGGSGSGINLSTIRSSQEFLKGGGTASGPVSFIRGADASAGTIKSGGKTRRAAKMVILNADHPDIEEFVWCKASEERKARALRDAGFDMDLDGKDSHSIQYQNANNSVRVTDEFMQAVLEDREWALRAVKTGDPIRTVAARDLMRQVSQASWECADPGMQFDSTINRWHTAPNTGRINASNPCSEYMHLDNSACNLASINLLKYLTDDGVFDVDGYRHTVEVMFTAQEILVGNADYPTEKIADNSRRFRQLGLGYANLGALLMAEGMPYDSDAGRAWAAALTALMTGHAYATSGRTAGRMGPFAGYAENADAMGNVLRMHRAEVAKIDEELVPPELLSAAQRAWDDAVETGERFGVRNAQATVLAPTGTIGLMMDCDTTGVEPDLALTKAKKLVGGGTMLIVNQSIPHVDASRVHRGAGRRDRPTHRRAQDDPRGARVRSRAPPGVRVLDGRQHDPLHGSREDDGSGAALHLGCHLEDRQHARGRDGRGRRRAPHRGVETGPEGRCHLPRQLQGRATARDAEEGRLLGGCGSARPGRGADRRARHRAGARTPEAAAHPQLEDVLVPRRRLPGVRDRLRVRGRPAR